MHRVSVEGPLDAPAETAWAVLAAFDKVGCYHPRVQSARITNQIETGLGAQRVCALVDGESVTETIIAYEEGRGYTTEVTGVGKPVKRVFGQVELMPGAGTGCRVRFGVAFEPRFGPLGWLLSVLLMRPLMRRQLRGTFRALDHYLRTGAKIGGEGGHAAAPPAAASEESALAEPGR